MPEVACSLPVKTVLGLGLYDEMHDGLKAQYTVGIA